MAPEPEAQAPGRWPGRDAAGDNRAEGTRPLWVLSWIPDVKVLAPKSLRDRIAEKLQDGLRRQDEASGPNDKGCIAGFASLRSNAPFIVRFLC
jgi:hypothetical protein